MRSSKHQSVTGKEIEQKVDERIRSLEIINRQLESELARRRQAENHLRKLTCAVIHSPFSIMMTDDHGTIEYVNPRFTELTGYEAREVIGKNPRMFKSDKTSPDAYRDFWNTIKSGKVWEGEFCNQKKSGELYWQFFRVAPVRNVQGHIMNYVAVMCDVSSRVEKERDLEKAIEHFQYVSFHDPLTGLYNSAFFNEEILRMSRDVVRFEPITVMAMDVDGLKAVNDTFGHQRGDEHLIHFASVIQAASRAPDIIARIGGDEFGVIVPNMDRNKAAQRKMSILKRFENFSKTHPDYVPLQVSIGLATSRGTDKSIYELLRKADEDMYKQKFEKKGKSR